MADHHHMTIDEFVAAKLREPQPILPCAVWVSDWVLAQTGVDPIADLRWDWSDITVKRQIVSEGGLVAMADRRFAAAGLSQIEEPASGCVGVVLAGEGEALAIRGAAEWIGPGPNGVVIGKFEMVRAWGLPCRS